ncbi:MAG: NAD(P)-dependent oxidoreductase [Deltaproteobacteria bacterium]
MSSGWAGSSRLVGRRCLVTGAGGFLGRRVVARLVAAGAQVTAHVRAPAQSFAGAEVSAGDLTAPDWRESARRVWRWDDVVHLAGPVSGAAGGFVSQAQTARAHVQLALAVAGALPKDWSGRVVHASSMTVYGAAPSLPVQESQELLPRFPYALGKVLAEDVWRAAARPDVWLLRLPGLFSAQRQSGALFHFVRAGLSGRPLHIQAPEPTLWDLLHVDDAAEAVARALASERSFSGAMNVSYGEVVDLQRVARRVIELTQPVELVNDTPLVHPPFQLDIRLARDRLDWPPLTLDERLRQFVAELRSAI